MIINDLYNNNAPVLSEGDVVPFKRAAVSWQKLPKDVLSLANDWFWADFEGGGLQATMDPKGLGSGFANQQKYLGAQLQQRGWAIDIDDEYENIVLKNQQGQTILLPIEDAQDFTGWAQGTNSVSEQGVAEGGIATVGWPDEGNHTGNMPPVSVGGTFPARPSVKQGSLVKASGLTGVHRVMDIRGDEAYIVQEIPNSGGSNYVPMSDLRVWTNKPVVREQGVAEGNYQEVHRIGLTVIDPNHPMVSKRQEQYQKSVRVTSSDREAAINQAIAHFRRKGYKVLDHHYLGTVDQPQESLGDEMAAMAQKKFPNAYISKNGKEVQKPENWGKKYTPPATAPMDLEKQRRDLTAKYPNIDELVRRAELNRDPNYERADGQAYYAARDAEQNYLKLRQIQRVIQGLNESLNRSHLP
jgi:hypothetical protein